MSNCPFCGSGDIHIGSNETKENYPDTWFCYCAGCGAQGPAVTSESDEPGALPWVVEKYSVRASERWEQRAEMRDGP